MAVRCKNGRYIIDYYPQGRKGRRVVFTLPVGATDEQARQIEKEIRMRKKNTRPVNPSGNITRLVPHYLKHCGMHQSPDTTRDKTSCFQTHLIPYFGNIHIEEITNAYITAFKQAMKNKTYRERPLTNRTITKVLNYLSAFLKWVEEELNISPAQPLRIRKLPFTRPVPIVLSLNEAMALIQGAEKPFNVMFKTFFYLGLRNRAVRCGKWEDVDWASKALKTTEKGNKLKWHPLPDDLFEELRQLYIGSKSQWIYPSPRNFSKPINNIRRAVARAKKMAGINKRVHPHLLRHSIATHLLNSDVDIRQIQDFLDHSQISTTEWYTQVSMEKKRQALEKAGIKTTKVN